MYIRRKAGLAVLLALIMLWSCACGGAGERLSLGEGSLLYGESEYAADGDLSTEDDDMDAAQGDGEEDDASPEEPDEESDGTDEGGEPEDSGDGTTDADKNATSKPDRTTRGSSKKGETSDDPSDEDDASVTSDKKTSSTKNTTATQKTTKSTKSTKSTKTTTKTTTKQPAGGSESQKPSDTTKTTTTTTTTTKKSTTTTKKTRPTGPEKPVTGNTALLWGARHSVYDDEAEQMRVEILDAADSVKAASGKKTYYISPTGKDSNPGTKEAPWKTHEHINDGTVKSGDVVLFQRGGVYRNVAIELPGGVSLGAYGSGEKPQLYGGDRNYGYEDEWQKTDTANVWRTKVNYQKTFTTIRDIGNIIFDHGVKTASEGKKLSESALNKDYDFYFDDKTDYIYLYLSKGNPGALHDSIEMAPNEHIVRASRASNCVIENLCIKYTGAHGIVFSVPGHSTSTNNIVRGCDIGYIGGGMLWWEAKTNTDANGDGDKNDMVRFGNGIEINVGETGTADGYIVEDNWIYHCYDAGYTNQGNGWHKALKIRDNLIEYCQYNIEIWTHKTVGKGGLVDCVYERNVLRFAGFSFGTFNRIGSNSSVCANFSCYNYVIPSENTVIRNNVFDCSYRYLVSIVYPNDANNRGPTITGNTWIQQIYGRKADTLDSLGTTSCVGQTLNDAGKRVLHHSVKESVMKTSVKVFDTNPKKIIWDN